MEYFLSTMIIFWDSQENITLKFLSRIKNMKISNKMFRLSATTTKKQIPPTPLVLMVLSPLSQMKNFLPIIWDLKTVQPLQNTQLSIQWNLRVWTQKFLIPKIGLILIKLVQWKTSKVAVLVGHFHQQEQLNLIMLFMKVIHFFEKKE